MNNEPNLSDCAHAIQQRIEGRTDPAFSDSDFTFLARQIFSQQLRHNESYHLFCQRRGTAARAVEHWSQIPAMPAAAFKEQDVTCLPPAERLQTFHSSGTTTHQPSRHHHSPASLALYEASAFAGFKARISFGSPNAPCPYRGLCLTPSPTQAPHSSLVHMFETVRQRGNFSQFDYVGEVDADKAWTLDLDRTVKRLTGNYSQPFLLLGTAFSYVQLGDYLQACKVQASLQAGSVALETGGYKGRTRALPKMDLHRLIQSELGIAPDRIVCEYGMSELSSQAYDSTVASPATATAQKSLSNAAPDSNRIFRFSPWARALVVSPENGAEVQDGETGLIRVIDLANVYSVLALQTEDLGIRHGNGFTFLGRATGAENRGCSIMAASPVP